MPENCLKQKAAVQRPDPAPDATPGAGPDALAGAGPDALPGTVTGTGPDSGSDKAPGLAAFLASLRGPLTRRFGCMIVAQWGSGFMAALFTVLLARGGTEAFGLFSLAMALGVLVTMLTGAGFENYLVPRLTDGRVAMRRVLMQSLGLQSVLLLASMALLALLCALLGYGAGKSLLVLLIALGMGPAAMAQSFFALCRVLGRQGTEMRIRVIAACAGSAFGIVCVWQGAPLALTACFKIVEALVLWLLIARALRWRFSGFAANWGDWAGHWRDGLLFFGIAVCGLLYNKLCLYMLDHYSGSSALGLFNAPWEIVDGLCILISGALIEKVMFPLMAGQWKKDRAAFLRLNSVAVRCLLLLALGASFLFYAEGDRILALIFGAQYAPATAVFKAQLLCIPAAFLHNLAACMLLSMHIYRAVFVIYLCGLAVNIVLCLACIPAFGALGAAFAISGTKALMMCATMGLALRFGLVLEAKQVGAALLAALLAFGILGASPAALPREAAESLALLPLLALAWLWLPSILRETGAMSARPDAGPDGQNAGAR